MNAQKKIYEDLEKDLSRLQNAITIENAQLRSIDAIGGGQNVAESLLVEESLLANPENTAEPIVVNDILST